MILKRLMITMVMMSVLFLTLLQGSEEQAVPTMSPGFRVINTGDTFTEIEFSLDEYELIPFEIDGVTYHRLYHPQSGFLMHQGLPEVLSFSALISVPARGAVSYEEPLVQKKTVKDNITIFPSQGFNIEVNQETGFVIDTDFYSQDTDYPGKPLVVSPPAIMRDYRLITVNINPFSFNPARSELTVLENLTFRLTYDLQTSGTNEITRAPRRTSRDFEKLFRDSVLNHEQFHNPHTRNEYQKRSIIVVHNHNQDATYRNSLDLYLNWKRDKGFEVNVITTANYTNNTAIRNYILNAYENWEDPPEHVIMIGNKSGTFSVPIWSILHPETYNAPNVAVDTDHPYTTLDGDDDLADLFVGRINVANGNQLASYWNKIRNYERTPFMGNTAWYNRQLLVGDPRVSGISTIFTNRYIKDLMLRHNPNYNINEVYAVPFNTAMQTSVNQGVSFFNFRGLEDVAGWWYPNENDLNNGFMMPNHIIITCRTMLWSANLHIDALFNMGTPATAKGSITGIGMSHVTRTAFNNSLAGGIFYGLFVDDMNTMGEALMRGKLNLWQAFFNSHWAAEGRRHTRMINLFGDPSMNIWKGVPQNLTVDYPAQLPPGSNSIRFVVTDDNDNPVEGVWLTIRKGNIIGQENIFVTGYTDAEGTITHFFAPNNNGTVTVTATKPDYKPHLGNFEITGNPAVSFNSVTFNGAVRAGTQPNFIISVRNHRAQAVNGINGTITTDSEYIEIDENNSAFGNIGANSNADSVDEFVITIAPDTPSGHKARFNLVLTDNAQNSWLSRFEVAVHNGHLVKTRLEIDDDGDGVLDPTEQATIFVYVENTGQADLVGIQGVLTGGGYGLTIVNNTAIFGNIEAGQRITSRENHFVVSTSSFVVPGMNFNLTLTLSNEDGFSQIVPVTIPIGTVTVNDPLGPCPYGYWIYDSGDTDYVEAPVYEWIEISPGLGGNGVNTGLTADWNNIQNVVARDLPFTFRFYGEEYDVVSISANGWITFGTTEMSTQRNWLLPGPLGPSPIIAAFWDNLSLAQGGVFTWFDQENAKFVIQWQNARNIMGNAEETFQIILYDPEFYFTTTNDGPIKIQYRVFNNVNNGSNTPAGLGNWGNYATIGIADHTCKRGLQYTFNNRYPTAARPLGNGTALYIATGSLGAAPYVAIDSFSYVDGENNIPEFGRTGSFNMNLANIGGQDAFGVTAILSSNDEYVTILQDERDFGDIPSEENVNINNAYTIRIADDIPDNHRLTFFLAITAEGPINWNFRFHIDVKAPDFKTLTPLIYDPLPGGNNNGLVDPGEELIVYLPIKNQGGAHSPAVNLNITSQNDLAQITGISETAFDTIIATQIMYPAISITISPDATEGTGLVFNYEITTGEYEFTGNFLLGVGGIIPAQLGTGNAVTAASAASPINIYFRTLRGQSIYTAEELRNAGVTSGGPISSLGFYVVTAPQFPLPNFIVRMKHTTATLATHHIEGPYSTVFTANNHSPTAGGFDMIQFNQPFEWNGVDNILVDTAFSPVQSWSGSGQVRYYETENGYRYTRADSPDQTNVDTNTANSEKPQIRLMVDTSAGDASNRPENLTATFEGRDVILLNWIAPLEQQGLLGYNVYRNGILLNQEPVAETEYRDEEFARNSTLYYYVTAVYEIRETLPSNIVAVNLNIAETPEISPEEGVYKEPVNVTITTNTEDALIYYTLDGSEPTEESYLYEEPFIIDYHTELKAKAFSDDLSPSETASAVYHILHPARNLRAEGTLQSVTLRWDAPWTPERITVSKSNDHPPAAKNNLNLSLTSERGERSIRSSRISREYHNRNSQSPRTLRGYNVYRSFEDEDFTISNPRLITATTFNDNNLPEGDYRYYVVAVYEQGEANHSNIIYVGPLSVDDESGILPETELLNAYPNPFNPETMIGFTLNKDSEVLIEVYDTRGRKVKTLAQGIYSAGRHTLVWKGEDDNSRRASSGIYFYRMQTEGYTQTRKLLMLK